MIKRAWISTPGEGKGCTHRMKQGGMEVTEPVPLGSPGLGEDDKRVLSCWR